MKQLALLVSVLFIAIVLYVIYMPPRQITLKDLQKDPLPYSLPDDTDEQETILTDEVVPSGNSEAPPSNKAVIVNNDSGTVNTNVPKAGKVTDTDSKETVSSGSEKIQANYFIIIESYKNLTFAQQKAEKLKKYHNADIFALPPTPEGNCRISYGKYSTMEEAQAAIQSLRTKFGQGIWIYAMKK